MPEFVAQVEVRFEAEKPELSLLVRQRLSQQRRTRKLESTSSG